MDGCFIILFVSFWLCWVFVAAHGLSLVAASGGCSLVAASGGYSLVAIQGLLIVVASLIAEHRF